MSIVSCGGETGGMDEWEGEMAKNLKAERVELYHQGTTSTTNGRYSAGESYLQLDIYNSEVLMEIQHNDRLLNKKCKEIRDIVLHMPTIELFPVFDELRIGLVETRGFSFLKSHKTNTIKYRVD